MKNNDDDPTSSSSSDPEIIVIDGEENDHGIAHENASQSMKPLSGEGIIDLASPKVTNSKSIEVENESCGDTKKSHVNKKATSPSKRESSEISSTNPFAQFAVKGPAPRKRKLDISSILAQSAAAARTDRHKTQDSSSATHNKSHKKPEWVRMKDHSTSEQQRITEKWLSLSFDKRTNPDGTTTDTAYSLQDRRFQVLVAARIHARCQETSVRQAMNRLNQTMPITVAHFSTCEQQDIEEAIKNLQFYSTKANQLQTAARQIRDLHNSIVPEGKDQLKSIMGIGPMLADLLAFVNTRNRHTAREQQQQQQVSTTSNPLSNDVSSSSPSQSLISVKRIQRGRRRGRPLNQPKRNTARKKLQALNDDDLDFLAQQNIGFYPTNKAPKDTVLGLLMERESGFLPIRSCETLTGRSSASSSCSNRFRWQRRMMYEPKQKVDIRTDLMTETLCMRKLVDEQVPFTALETHTSVAILALQCSGSYALGLKQTNASHQFLAEQHSREGVTSIPPTLCFEAYGLPTLNSFAQKRRIDKNNRHNKANKRLVAPRLMTLPLAFDDDDHEFSWVHATSTNRPHFQEANRPRAFARSLARQRRLDNEMPIEELYGHNLSCVDLYVSRDWHLGLAVVRKAQASSAPRQETLARSGHSATDIVSLSLLPLGQCSRSSSEGNTGERISIPRAMHVPVSRMKAGVFGLNMLWSVHSIPLPSNTCKIRSYCSMPAYLLLVDDSEGYRLSWVSVGGWQNNRGDSAHGIAIHDHATIEPSVEDGGKPTKWVTPTTPILTPISHSEPPYWKSRMVDKQTGHAWYSNADDDDDDDDAEEEESKFCAPQIEILLECQLFIYPLLSDILRRYPSIKASKLENAAYELLSISHGCGRTAKVVVGVPTDCGTVNSTSKKTQNVAVVVAIDLWLGKYKILQWVRVDDPNEFRPEAFAKSIQNLAFDLRKKEMGSVSNNGKEKKIQKRLGDGEHNFVSSLYPDADFVSNRAVLRGVPVMKIGSRSHVELVYG